MKKILFVFSVLLLFGSCGFVSLMSAKNVSYSVTGGESANISYLNEYGDKIGTDINTPWEYSGNYSVSDNIGISAIGSSEITVTVKFFGGIKTITSDELILIYIY